MRSPGHLGLTYVASNELGVLGFRPLKNNAAAHAFEIKGHLVKENI